MLPPEWQNNKFLPPDFNKQTMQLPAEPGARDPTISEWQDYKLTPRRLICGDDHGINPKWARAERFWDQFCH